MPKINHIVISSILFVVVVFMLSIKCLKTKLRKCDAYSIIFPQFAIVSKPSISGVIRNAISLRNF